MICSFLFVVGMSFIIRGYNGSIEPIFATIGARVFLIPSVLIAIYLFFRKD